MKSLAQFIAIDQGKCGKPEDCTECLKTCPLGVLLMIPIGSGKANEAPRAWKIKPRFPEQCNGCGLCAEKCPRHAIQIRLA